MKTVFVLFDSLNRHLLEPYGGTRIPTPNFKRLAERSCTFDGHYVGSMPCMPARRDIMTGRLSFLHRSWGPLEPFDNAYPELLAKAGAYTHLVTDHFHYFEDGGATYHTRYDTYEFVRGQEGDRWKALVKPHWDRLKNTVHENQFSTARRNYQAQNVINREMMDDAEEAFPSAQVFKAGVDFIEKNRDADDWLVQIETFDPHEPFIAPSAYKKAFETGWNGPAIDWPRYGRVEDLPAENEELRANYYATVAHCDALLGRLLDEFDRHDMWKDTVLIVTTDHGFLLGEHDFWAKNRMTIYEEIAHIPLFVHHPDHAAADGTRCGALTQNADLAATFVDLYGAERPAEMQAPSLLPLLAGEPSPREAVLYGYFGGAVNVTDGRHTYHRYPADIASQEIYQYTLMPTHIFDFFHEDELRAATLAPPLDFSRDMPLLKVPVGERSAMYKTYGPGCLLENETRLYDLASDPAQANPLDDPALEARMAEAMVALMGEVGAPPEAYARLALEAAPVAG